MDTQLIEEMIEEYKKGEKMTTLFKKYHTSYSTLARLLDERGIDHSRKARKKGLPNLKNARILTVDEEKLVCEIYQKTGRQSECEKAINGGQDVVRRCLIKYGLYRTASEAIKQSPQNQRKYPVKDTYFDEQNPRMAYILGFLAADGTVRKDSNEIKLGLSSVDEDFLKELQKEVGGRPVKTYETQKGFLVSSWAFTSAHIKEKLKEYNIVPNKTFTFTFPLNLKREYWKDFIRGYFDGDGCISTAGPSAIRFQIGSATKDVLEKIVSFFCEYGIPKTSILEITKERGHYFYYIQYSSVPTKRIYDILYYDGCLCLPRKREKYKKLIE